MAKFIYGGTTGETPETIARKREMAMALIANQGTPRDIGEGLNAIGDALLARRMYKSAGRAEEAGKASAPKFGFDPVMSALTRQSPAAAGNSVMAALDPKAPASVEERMGGRPFDAVREALIKQESGGNPNAISPKGAVGVTQVMPDTAMDPGYGVPTVFDIAQAKGIQVASRDKATAIELLKNPQVNEELGGKYFDAMANRFGGNLQQAAAAYNGGPGRLESVGGDIGRMPAETQAYVPAVTGGQPVQVAQAGGIDPEVYAQAMAVLQHPFADPQSKAAAQAYIEQAQKQSDPKYQLEIQKLEKDVRDDGKPWYIRPDNTVDPAYIEAARAAKSDTNITLNDQKLTEGQSKDVGFLYRGSMANEDLASLEPALTQIDQSMAERFGGSFGKFYTSPEFKQANRAASEFLAVILRKDTGAAVSPQEFDLYGPMYLPAPGDDPQTVAAKREARTRALDAIYMGLGTARNLGDDVKKRVDQRRANTPVAPAGETVIDGYTIKPKGQ